MLRTVSMYTESRTAQQAAAFRAFGVCVTSARGRKVLLSRVWQVGICIVSIYVVYNNFKCYFWQVWPDTKLVFIVRQMVDTYICHCYYFN